MADLPYSTVILQWQDAGFVGRVQVAALTVAKNLKLMNGLATDASEQAISEDRLARQICAAPVVWGPMFAYLVAIQLIGKSSLTDTSVTTDGDIFSAVIAVYDAFITRL